MVPKNVRASRDSPPPPPTVAFFYITHYLLTKFSLSSKTNVWKVKKSRRRRNFCIFGVSNIDFTLVFHRFDYKNSTKLEDFSQNSQTKMIFSDFIKRGFCLIFHKTRGLRKEYFSQISQDERICKSSRIDTRKKNADRRYLLPVALEHPAVAMVTS